MTHLNPQHAGVHHQVVPQRRHGVAHQLEGMVRGEMTTTAGYIKCTRTPEPPHGSYLTDLGGSGVVEYPGRTMHLQHPAGATLPAIYSSEVRWAANPVCAYNPVLADSQRV